MLERILEIIISIFKAIGAIFGVICETIAEALYIWYDEHRDRVPYYIFRIVFFLICCGILQWAIWYMKCLIQNLFG